MYLWQFILKKIIVLQILKEPPNFGAANILWVSLSYLQSVLSRIFASLVINLVDFIREQCFIRWKCWERPRSEKDIVGEWVGCIYASQKRIHLFVGKVLRRWSSSHVFTTVLEIECLEEKLGTTDCVFKENERRDVGIFAIQNVICGPAKANFLGGKKWEIPQYENIRKIFSINKFI